MSERLQWGLGFLAEEGEAVQALLDGLAEQLQWGLGFLAEEGRWCDLSHC